MSSNWLMLVPDDPHFVPGADEQLRARDRLAEIAPNRAEVEIRNCDTVQFFDCGANFERVCCPSCKAEISLDWWGERMDEDYDGGFKLAAYRTPCCDALRTLRELNYEWPQTFGRFALAAKDPSLIKLDDALRNEFEAILGTKLIVIWRHL